ncbi:adenosylcobalamin-dependent ribonucleoside-diphosphate reductase [Algoriphagus lacus]|uniref:Vitamin B12-dependent ribonucleotide reductase n=1 Tax=Algoriphagus lacus TaxID=2056311 RepID=A0A418PUG5_9BACT|nr:adenosylcobalamin-dependent ribonucleoside-diphosphate reductase [Algoriphagus lacus]RIW17200.1 adenosylcobalamin-dependent ribonucleoside-diphosphate reductase [Algoriphagus lacus]
MELLSENARKILQERYLIKDAAGRSKETPEELLLRVAKTVAQAEKKYGSQQGVEKWEREFFGMMSNLDFLPNSTTLMNAGTGYGQLSSCFVLPVKDSLSGIFQTLRLAALVQQKGGGTGFNFSELRPSGDHISQSGGQSSGPVSFIRVFDFAAEHIRQGGKRRGANMGILNVDHPDIFEFIRLRTEGKRLKNFNLSVGISDSFMKALEANADWNLINPRTGKSVRMVKSGVLWSELCEQAWLSGNPGLIFLDTINAANPVISIGEIAATNPCGEVPLLPNESCNLGSINLTKFVKTVEAERTELDWKKLGETVEKSIRFLDNVLDINKFPSESISKASLANRKIGLGVMGWAELLIRLGIPYASVDAISLAERLMSFIQEKSLKASSRLGIERGSFPNWEKSVFFPDQPMRNATRTSIAPTGTISILADTSSSVEPLFALAFQRKNVLNGETLQTINPLFLEMLKSERLAEGKILDQVISSGTCTHIKELPGKFRELFRTALEISPEWHLRHQIAFQKFTDNAVSKTVNLPSDSTIGDVDQLYRQAWELGAKGITVFRNEAGDQQLLYRGIKSSGPEFIRCVR